MRLLGILAAVVLVTVGLLWALQRHLIYLPSDATVPPAATALRDGEDVVLQTGDGVELGAWYVPPRSNHRELAVLVANGNAGDRSARAPLARALAARGFGVMLFDYRGYGANPGQPSEQGLICDAKAAQRWLVTEGGFAPDQILYFGESLGAAVVTALATAEPPAGLVLRSPFVDLASVGQVHYPFLPVRTLLRERYPVAEQIATVSAPVTVVYGSADSVVPAEQSRAVADAAPVLHDVVEVTGADHNDEDLLTGDQLLDAVESLAERVRRRSSG